MDRQLIRDAIENARVAYALLVQANSVEYSFQFKNDIDKAAELLELGAEKLRLLQKGK